MNVVRTTLLTSAVAALAALLAVAPADAEDLCAGSNCRVMTAAEESAYWARLKALDAALPVAEAARFEPAGLEQLLGDVAGLDATMKQASVLRAQGIPLACYPWPAGCFPSDDRGVGRSYRRKEVQGGAKARDDDPLAVGLAMLGEVIVSATLNPYPFLQPEQDGTCLDAPGGATVGEKTATYLAFEEPDGESVRLTVAFGRRTCKDAETLMLEEPAAKLAPVVSVELVVLAPKGEIAALKKRIDRRAFEALLGPLQR